MTKIIRLRGLGVDLVRVEIEGSPGRRVIVSGEPWLISQKTAHSTWQGFTEDHLAETPRCKSLGAVVRWILTHQREWQTTLKVRREG